MRTVIFLLLASFCACAGAQAPYGVDKRDVPGGKEDCGPVYSGMGGSSNGDTWVVVSPCAIVAAWERLSGGKGREHGGGPGAAMLEALEAGRDLLEALRAEAAGLAVEVPALRENQGYLLGGTGTGAEEIPSHNARIAGLADRIAELNGAAEHALAYLIELEQSLEGIDMAAREGLLEASTALIIELENARRELAARLGELQGARVASR